jgi:hypothetical protein
MLFKFLDLVSVPGFERMCDDFCQITVGWHPRFARRRFKLGCVLVGEINGKVHGLQSLNRNLSGHSTSKPAPTQNLPFLEHPNFQLAGV